MEALSSIGKIWLGIETSPIVASTAEMASSTGTPAATIAPNATTRIRSVTGRDMVSALWRSLWIFLSSWAPEVASPNSSTRRLGLSCWPLLTAATTGAIRSEAVSASPLMSNWIMAECRSFDTSPALEPWPGALRCSTSGRSAKLAVIPVIPRLNAGSSVVSVSLWSSTSSEAGFGKLDSSVFSARPDSPVNWSALVSLLAGTKLETIMASATNTNHPSRTDFLWRALQPPSRAASPLDVSIECMKSALLGKQWAGALPGWMRPRLAAWRSRGSGAARCPAAEKRANGGAAGRTGRVCAGYDNVLM